MKLQAAVQQDLVVLFLSFLCWLLAFSGVSKVLCTADIMRCFEHLKSSQV